MLFLFYRGRDMLKIKRDNAIIVILAGLLSLCFQQVLLAKRAAPADVAPVDYEGVRYSAPASRIGVIEAHDTTTGEKLWEKKVYNIFYNPFLEKDIQDVYIVSLHIKGNELSIEDERKRSYRVKIPDHILKRSECGQCAARPFDFKKDLFDPLQTLFINVKSVDLKTGDVLITAMDTRAPKEGLVYNWGDGQIERGDYRKTHVYKDKSRNYCLMVTARYSGESAGRTEALIRFVSAVIKPPVLPETTRVEIPDHPVQLVSRTPDQKGVNPVVGDHLTYFDDAFFNLVSRQTVEYVLSAASSILYDLFDGDVVKENNGFKQALLRDQKSKGMCAFWYTRPITIVSGDYGFRGVIQYSSFFHEIGHSYVLNFPLRYCYGDKLSGAGGDIFVESMAQIIQHALAYEMVNHYDKYGLSEDVAFDVKRRAVNTMGNVRQGYESYKAKGMKFCSWGEEGSELHPLKLDTCMTIAYVFFVHAENSGKGYLCPLKRMITFLRIFDEDIKQRYDSAHDTPEASIFRATFMTAALSCAFDDDLRQEFKDLNFPVDDARYVKLLDRFRA